MKIKKLAFIFLIVLFLLPLLAVGLVNTPPGRAMASSLASKWLQREVQFTGHLYPISIWPPGLRVRGLTVANMESGRAPYMANIGTMNVTWERKGGWRIRQLALIDSNLNLERDSEGRTNWTIDTGTKDKDGPIPPLGNLYLENSRIVYYDAPKNTDITLEATTQADHFTLIGGGKHFGRQFELKGEVAASCLTKRIGSCPLEATLNVGYTSLHAKGTLSELVPPEGADFMLDIKGASAAELFPLFGIAMPPTAPYHLKGHLTYGDDRWHFEDFSGTMGESDLQGKLLWDKSRERPKLTATFTSNQLRFIDLGPLIGLAPEKRQSETQKELAAYREASPLLIPNMPLDISRVSAMDAEVEFTGKQVISESVPLDDFHMKLSLDNRLMKLTPIRFGTARGDISADITVDAREESVHNRANIRFSHLKLAELLRGVSKAIPNLEPPEGEIGGVMKLSGPGKSFHEMLAQAKGVAGIGMEGGSISNLLVKLLSLDIARSLGFLLSGDKPLAIRCIVASFDINEGVMKTDTFVIDTADTNITGEGSVHLKTEEMALRILPAPKEASALSLRSPIDIRGTFKNPDVVIEKGPLAARGGVATALAAVAPLAAVVALVDPGLGKDSNCPDLISRMNAKTGTTPRTDEVPKNPKPIQTSD